MNGRILSALLAVVVMAACSEGEAAEDGPSYTTTAVTRGDLRITVEATGAVEPIRNLEVKSQASGEILRLHVEVGDDVTPGTLLAEVDPRDVRNGYEQAEADLAVARSRSQIAEQQLARQEELLEAGVITQQELEAATLEAANAQANLVRSRTNFELAELRLNDVTIRAPLAGTVLSRNVEEGTVIQSASQNVSGGTVLFTMANLERMQVRTLVDETDVGQLAAGMPASVTVEAFPDRSFNGTVEKIEPQAVVEQNVTLFPVIVTLDNRDGLLRPGMNAEVEVLVDEANGVILVPNNAIVNVRDVIPAAMAIGLSTDDMEGFGGRPGAGGGPPGGGSTGGPPAGASSGRPQGGGGPPAGATGGRPGAPVEEGGVAQDMRTAAVFVMVDGVPEPRMIRIGLNDWDNTAAVSGLEGDEELAVVGAAQIRAAAQARIRRFTGGSGLPFGN